MRLPLYEGQTAPDRGLPLRCNTPIRRIQVRIGGKSRSIYLKLEGENPGGSIKDRIGRSMIEAAEATVNFRYLVQPALKRRTRRPGCWATGAPMLTPTGSPNSGKFYLRSTKLS